MRRWLRKFWNIRWKITWAMFLLLLISEVISVAVFSGLVDDALYRGPYLIKHFKRFNDDWRRSSSALALAALSYGEETSVHAALRVGAVAPETAAESVKGSVFFDHFKRLRSRMKPDVFAVLDRRGVPLFIAEDSPLTPEELATMKFAATALATELVAPVVHRGRLFIMAGVPIREPSGEPVGAVLLGRDMRSYMTDFSEASDTDESKRHVLTFVAGDKVVTSSAPEALWGELSVALLPENRAERREGTKKVLAIKLGSGDKVVWHDVFEEELNGFSAGQEGKIGKLVITRNRTQQETKQTDMVNRLIIFLVGAIVFALFIGYAVSTMISRPVDRLIQVTAELARGGGDLTVRLDDGGTDELARLARNMNQMFENLRTLALKVQGASLQVGASSAELSAASKQMLAGATDQAVKIEDSSAAVTELSTSIQSVAENAGLGIRVAREGGDSVNKAIEGMNRIRSTVEEASVRIRELGESSKKIGNIVSVIQQISEQTSLLALNAAIEAARAGEQGRGFAVVADEVGQLAKRVGKSAKDIEALIATIKEQTETSVTTMQAGTKEVESGASLVNDTLRHLTAIIETVQETARSVKEQAIASDAIARNMEEVRRISHDMLGASKETVQQGDNLHSLAVGLEESVKTFRLHRTELDAISVAGHLPAHARGERGARGARGEDRA